MWSVRFVLLLAAHSDRSHLAQRFERFVAMSVTNLRKAGRGALGPRILSVRMKEALLPTKLEVTKRSVCLSSLDALRQAYRSVVARGPMSPGLGRSRDTAVKFGCIIDFALRAP